MTKVGNIKKRRITMLITNKADTRDFLEMLSEGDTIIPDARNAKYVYVFRRSTDKVTFAHIKVAHQSSDFATYQIDCNVVWSIRNSINKWLSSHAA